MPYWEEPKYNDPDEVEGPDDVTLPGMLHHMQAKAELKVLMQEGCIEPDEAEQVLKDWSASRKMAGNDRELKAAVDELESRGLLEGEEADSIKRELPG